MITVRPAQRGDGAALVAMALELSEAHGNAGSFAMTPAMLEEALFSPSPIVGALVALVDGEPAGSSVWHRSFSTNRGQEVMYLEDLCVLEKFRRRGVAKALMRETARLAVAMGYAKIYWMVMSWNEGALSMYEQLGTEVDRQHFICSLADDKLKALAT